MFTIYTQDVLFSAPKAIFSSPDRIEANEAYAYAMDQNLSAVMLYEKQRKIKGGRPKPCDEARETPLCCKPVRDDLPPTLETRPIWLYPEKVVYDRYDFTVWRTGSGAAPFLSFEDVEHYLRLIAYREKPRLFTPLAHIGKNLPLFIRTPRVQKRLAQMPADDGVGFERKINGLLGGGVERVLYAKDLGVKKAATPERALEKFEDKISENMTLADAFEAGCVRYLVDFGNLNETQKTIWQKYIDQRARQLEEYEKDAGAGFGFFEQDMKRVRFREKKCLAFNDLCMSLARLTPETARRILTKLADAIQQKTGAQTISFTDLKNFITLI